MRYIENWENTRQEQQNMICENSEKIFANKIQNLQTNIDTENQCNEGIKMFLIQNLNEMREECEFWKEKYDHDYEQVELDIHIAKDELNEFFKYDIEMKLLYQQRREKMNAWIKYKEEKIYFASMVKCIVNIQVIFYL